MGQSVGQAGERREQDAISTGVPSLDTLLGGGILRGAVVLLVGAPGTGKTMLAQQIAFQAVADGKRVLFLTGYSETHEKLIAHSRGLSFFRHEHVGREIQLTNLLDLLRTGSTETEDAIVATARAQQAQVVVIDGLQGIRRSLPDEPAPGAFLYSLGAKLALIGVTTIVAMEGDADDPARYPELTVSDVILALRREAIGLRYRRVLDIVKVRGADAAVGGHPFTIGMAGVTVYPRFESAVVPVEPVWSGRRDGFGIATLDRLLGGGLPAGTMLLSTGVPGTGKTLLGLHFAAEGVRRGEPVLLVNFTESQVQLREQAAMFGMDFASAEAAGQLRLVATPAFDIDVDRIAYELSADIARREVRRLVIDSIAELERATAAQGRTADFLAALVAYLRSRDVTSYLTLDTPSLVGPELTLADSPLAVVAENLLLVRRSEYRGQLRRLLSVLKMRYSEHDHAIYEYVIRAQRGIEIIGAVPPAEGWLTGLARPIPESGTIGR